MPCLVAAVALLFPRLVIVLLAVFGTYLHDAYETPLWPLLGFIFLPFTTLAYALAMNAGGGLAGIYLVIFVIAVLLDLGSFGGSYSSRGR